MTVKNNIVSDSRKLKLTMIKIKEKRRNIRALERKAFYVEAML